MLVLILLAFACAAFVVNTFQHGTSLNFDAAGKALLVGAVIAHLF